MSKKVLLNLEVEAEVDLIEENAISHDSPQHDLGGFVLIIPQSELLKNYNLACYLKAPSRELMGGFRVWDVIETDGNIRFFIIPPVDKGNKPSPDKKSYSLKDVVENLRKTGIGVIIQED